MMFNRAANHIGPATMQCSDDSFRAVLRMPGSCFSLVMNRQRDSHKRRLVAFLDAVADESVEVHDV